MPTDSGVQESSQGGLPGVAQIPEAEQHLRKVKRAQATGDTKGEIQPNPAAAADQLAAQIAPTPAIPARPETADTPSNVVQRQQAGIQPLPGTGVGEEESEEEKVDLNQSVLDLVKKRFWVANDIGEPRVDSAGPGQINISYDDSSQIVVRVEVRPGEFGGVGRAPADKREAEARQKLYSEQKHAREELAKQALATKKEEEEKRDRRKGAVLGAAAASPAPEPHHHEESKRRENDRGHERKGS